MQMSLLLNRKEIFGSFLRITVFKLRHIFYFIFLFLVHSNIEILALFCHSLVPLFIFISGSQPIQHCHFIFFYFKLQLWALLVFRVMFRVTFLMVNVKCFVIWSIYALTSLCSFLLPLTCMLYFYCTLCSVSTEYVMHACCTMGPGETLFHLTLYCAFEMKIKSYKKLT